MTGQAHGVGNKRGPGRIETVLGVAIIGCLAGILAWVLFQQARLSPAVSALRPVLEPASAAGGGTAPSAAAAGFAALAPPALAAMGDAEEFDADTLSEKINGRADLYLNCGFEKLRAQRFALKSDPEQWLEWFEYDMGAPHNAFAVYALQRRDEAMRLSLTPHAYRTRNALFYVAGRLYVEAVGATADDALLEPMLTMAANHVAATPQAQWELPEKALFPPAGLRPDSYVLHISSAFGFEKFGRVFAARYDVAGAGALAFFTRLSDAAAAAALAREYGAFLLENGGRTSATPADVPGAQAVEMSDGVTVVFSTGPWVAGVQGVTNHSAAHGLAAALYRHLESAP